MSMSPTPEAPSGETLLPLSGINAATIEANKREIAGYQDSFMRDEEAELAPPLRLVHRELLKIRKKDPIAERGDYALRRSYGFLFTHRLVRRFVPGFEPTEEDFPLLRARIETVVQGTLRLENGDEAQYFPDVKDVFEHARQPDSFDALVRTFSTPSSFYGSQVLLLALVDMIDPSPGNQRGI